jgi:hypothetical protein
VRSRLSCPAGLGGGQTGDYKTPAASAFNVASSPYWGVEGLYEPKLDPWRLADNRQFMQNYYQLTTEYAKRGGVEYPVSIPRHLLDAALTGAWLDNVWHQCCTAWLGYPTSTAVGMAVHHKK